MFWRQKMSNTSPEFVGQVVLSTTTNTTDRRLVTLSPQQEREAMNRLLMVGGHIAPNPGPPPTMPVATLPAATVPDEIRRYRKLAEEIGIMPTELAKVDLMSALGKLGIEVYDFEKVWKFLKVEAQKHITALDRHLNGAYMEVVWRPLRGQDASGVKGIPGFKQGLYDKLVPMEALEVVKRVRDNIANSTFLVSDYDVVRPDPFLMVTTMPRVYAVIFHWDEPAWTTFKG